MSRRVDQEVDTLFMPCSITTYHGINIGMTIQEGRQQFELAQSIWWISSSIEHWSSHLKLISEPMIIHLQASLQHHHHYVMHDRLGEEEGEEERDDAIDVYGDGDGSNHGL
jgi:hypothetical protein